MAPPPKTLPKRFRKKWNNPHAQKARTGVGFRRWLRRNGYLTPNFRITEAACKDGTPVTHSRTILRNAQNHAFNLEQLRHELGGVEHPGPVVVSDAGVQHADRRGFSVAAHQRLGTDHTSQWVESVGRDRVDRAADKVFRDGGVGRYPAGSVHFDSRGWGRAGLRTRGLKHGR